MESQRTATSSRCSCTRLLRNPTTGKVSWVRLSCGRMSCCRCRKRILAKWKHHARELFRSYGATIYRITCDASTDTEWKSLYQRIERRRYDYLRLRVGSRFFVYIGGPLEGAEALRLTDAGIRCGREIASCPEVWRAISSSRGWKLAKPKRGDNELLDDRFISRDTIETVSAEFGVEVRECTPRSAKPDDWRAALSRVEEVLALTRPEWSSRDHWRSFILRCHAVEGMKRNGTWPQSVAAQQNSNIPSLIQSNSLAPVLSAASREVLERIRHLKNVLTRAPDDLESERELDELERSIGWAPLCA